jgi:hypothetical protein
MLVERRGDYPSEWAAMTAIPAKLGMTAETLRIWLFSTQSVWAVLRCTRIAGGGLRFRSAD